MIPLADFSIGGTVMDMDKSSNVILDLKDGEKVELTLNFYRLYQLQTKHPKDYKAYFELQKNGVHTDLDCTRVLHTAYLCANMEKMPDVMSYEEFLQKLLNGRNRIWKAYSDLHIDAKN